jgi:hypothetical protein
VEEFATRQLLFFVNVTGSSVRRIVPLLGEYKKCFLKSDTANSTPFYGLSLSKIDFIFAA